MKFQLSAELCVSLRLIILKQSITRDTGDAEVNAENNLSRTATLSLSRVYFAGCHKLVLLPFNILFINFSFMIKNAPRPWKSFVFRFRAK